MRDVSDITSPGLADQAIAETETAIEAGERAIMDGSPTANPDMVEEFRKELAELKELRKKFAAQT